MAITITTPAENNITVNETTQTVNVTNTTNTISVQTSGISATPAATTFSALTDVAVTTPYEYGHLISVDNQLKLVSRATVATNNANNRPVFQYSASNAGSNSSIVLKKHYGATNFANGDGTGIRFEVDSDQQPATEFAIIHAQYSTTEPSIIFATSTDDATTAYQSALRVSPIKTTVYGDLQVNGGITAGSATINGVRIGITELDGLGSTVISADENPAYDLIIQGGSTLCLQNDFIRFQKDNNTGSTTTNAYFNTASGRYSFNVTAEPLNETANLYVAGTFKSTGDATVNDLNLLGNTIYDSAGKRAIDLQTYTSGYGTTSYRLRLNQDVPYGIQGSFLVVDNIIEHNSSSLTTTSTATAVLDYWPVASVRSAKYLVQITNGTAHQMWEGMVIHDGTNIYLSAYGDIRTNGNLATMSVGFSATGNPELRVTPVNATQTKFKAAKTLIYV